MCVLCVIYCVVVYGMIFVCCVVFECVGLMCLYALCDRLCDAVWFVVERLIVFGTVFNKCVCVCLPGSCCMML